MKVTIGPYLNWIGPYQIAKKLHDMHLINESMATKIKKNELLSKVCNWIHSKKNRKVKIHIDNYDIWSAYNTLGMIILPMLKMVKADKHGYPFTYYEDAPHIKDIVEKEPWEKDDFGSYSEERWNYILDEMIHAFECINDDNWEDQFYSGKSDTQWILTDDFGDNDEKMYEMVKGPNDTFKIDYDGMTAAQKRIDNGLRLFGKYYQNLWT